MIEHELDSEALHSPSLSACLDWLHIHLPFKKTLLLLWFCLAIDFQTQISLFKHSAVYITPKHSTHFVLKENKKLETDYSWWHMQKKSPSQLFGITLANRIISMLCFKVMSRSAKRNAHLVERNLSQLSHDELEILMKGHRKSATLQC